MAKISAVGTWSSTKRAPKLSAAVAEEVEVPEAEATEVEVATVPGAEEVGVGMEAVAGAAVIAATEETAGKLRFLNFLLSR